MFNAKIARLITIPDKNSQELRNGNGRFAACPSVKVRSQNRMTPRWPQAAASMNAIWASVSGTLRDRLKSFSMPWQITPNTADTIASANGISPGKTKRATGFKYISSGNPRRKSATPTTAHTSAVAKKSLAGRNLLFMRHPLHSQVLKFFPSKQQAKWVEQIASPSNFAESAPHASAAKVAVQSATQGRAFKGFPSLQPFTHSL